MPERVHPVVTSGGIEMPLLRDRDDPGGGERRLPRLLIEGVAPQSRSGRRREHEPVSHLRPARRQPRRRDLHGGKRFMCSRRAAETSGSGGRLGASRASEERRRAHRVPSSPADERRANRDPEVGGLTAPSVRRAELVRRPKPYGRPILHGRPLTVPGLDEPADPHLNHGLTDGPAGDPVPLDELGLAGHHVAGLEGAGTDLLDDLVRDLHVPRYGPASSCWSSHSPTHSHMLLYMSNGSVEQSQRHSTRCPWPER